MMTSILNLNLVEKLHHLTLVKYGIDFKEWGKWLPCELSGKRLANCILFLAQHENILWMIVPRNEMRVHYSNLKC